MVLPLPTMLLLWFLYLLIPPLFFSTELGSASSVQWFGMSSSCQEVSFHSAVDRPDILATALYLQLPGFKEEEKGDRYVF